VKYHKPSGARSPEGFAFVEPMKGERYPIKLNKVFRVGVDTDSNHHFIFELNLLSHLFVGCSVSVAPLCFPRLLLMVEQNLLALWMKG